MTSPVGSKSRGPRRLATRLVFVIAGITVPVLVLAFLWGSARSYNTLREVLRAELETQSAITASNAAASLAFDNAREAESVLRSLELSPHVVSASLFTAEGQSFAAFDKRSGRPQATAGREALFRIESPVLVDGQRIGSIVVVGDFDTLWSRFRADLTGVFVLLALLMGAITTMAWYVAIKVTRPIGLLAGLMDRIAADHDYSLRAPAEGPDEIGRLSQHFNTMLARIEQHEGALSQELKQRQRAERLYAELAYSDSVTGLPNRRFFTEELDRRLQGNRSGGPPFALLFLDLDNFKGVNDTLGHSSGDHLLREVALALRHALREADVICRLGGDEFAVLLAGVDDRRVIQRVVEKAGAAARRAVTLNGAEVSVSASIGVALCPESGDDAATLLRNADTAMYQAKACGKDRSVVFTPELLQSVTRDFLIRGSLPKAIDRGELALHYQPIVALPSRHIVKVEALLRWNSASGPVAPAEFIPIAEESGAILAIGDWVLEEALAQLASWRAQGLGQVLSLSVNVSARQLRDQEFPLRVEQAMQRHGVQAKDVELELTESQMIAFDDVTTQVLAALETLGMKIVIDDFGTGFSSLAYLSRLNIDGIKVDRELVHAIDREEGRSVATAIQAMAQALGVEVVAEGVEREEQASILASLGIVQAQGWLFDKPMPADELATRLGGAMALAHETPHVTVGSA
jgi:diguanylate cyclase (GGDEF)-like protein